MKLESEYETMRAERDVALAEVDRLNEEAASLASQLAAQVAANETLRESERLDKMVRKTLEDENDRLMGELANLRVEYQFHAARSAAEIVRLKSGESELEAEVADLKMRPACGHTDYHEPHLWGVDETEYECPGIGYDNEGA